MNNNMNTLTDLIDKTIDGILDQWNAEAAEQDIDSIDYYESQLDNLDNEPGRFTSKAISARYLQRVMGVAR